MNDSWVTRGSALAIVVALWAVLYLPRLGFLEIQGEEGRRIIPALNMLRGAGWMVPEVSGRRYYSKPPGINWLVAASFTLTGLRSDGAARLPSVLALLALAMLLVLGRGPWLSTGGRLAAAVLCLTYIGMIEKGRLIEIEAVYVSLTGMSVVWWLDHWTARRSPWRLWIVPALMLSLGALIKGPFLGVVFYAVVLAVLLYHRRLRELFAPAHLVAVGIILTLCLGWIYMIHVQADSSAMAKEWSGQLGSRVMFEKFQPGKWASRIPLALVDLLPWVIFIPLLWVRPLTRNIDPARRPLFRALRLAMVVSFLTLDLMPGILPRYAMPAFPLACVLLGWLLSEHKAPLPSDRIWKATLLAASAVLAVAPLAALTMLAVMPAASLPKVSGLAAADLANLPHLPAAWCAAGATLLLCAGILWRRRWLKGGLNLAMATAMLCAAATLLYVAMGMPLRKAHEQFRPDAAALDRLVPPDQPLYAYRPEHEPMMRYVSHRVVFLLEPQQIDARVRYLLAEQHDLQDKQVKDRLAGPWRELFQISRKDGTKFRLLERVGGPPPKA
jgi:4-amino-4-deoxy-L-arabinose transferase-like glycosyltransferase